MLFRYSSELVLGLSREGEVRFCSPNAHRILGWAPQEIQGRSVLALVPEADARQGRALLRLLRSQSRMFLDVDLRVLHGDGRVRVFSVSARAVAEDGVGFDFVINAHDVTQVRAREEEKEHTLVLLQSLLDSAPDAVLLVDRNGTPTTWNEGFVRLWGFHPLLFERENTAILRTFATEMLADPEVFLDGLANANRSPDLRVHDEFRFQDGRVFERISLPHRIGDEWAGRVWYFRDRTQERHLAERLARGQKNEALGRLAGGVAHDFSNVLTGIHGNASLLLLDGDVPDVREHHALEIQKLAEQSEVLIRRLLTFSRQQTIQPKSLNLDELLGEAESMLQRLVGEDVEIVRTGCRGLGRVHADPGQIRQVLMNLAVNAREAMPDGGRLWLATSNFEVDEYLAGRHNGLRPGHYVRLDVGDTGVGIEPQIREQIFEPFFTTKPDATGLGLSTALGIVEQAGGAIFLESYVGRATTFTVLLPRTESSAPDPTHRPVRDSQGWETILLVEDDPAVRTTVGRVLKRSGYSVLFARHGSDAARMAESYRGAIHLMITDVVMPQMGGVELTLAVRERRPNLKVLFISGHAREANIAEMLDAGQTFFLQKPFDVQNLPDRVREILDA